MTKCKIKMIQYRGYTGIAYKKGLLCTDGYYGTVTTKNGDLVTFESDNYATLYKSFCDAVDDYCLTCEELGKPW